MKSITEELQANCRARCKRCTILRKTLLALVFLLVLHIPNASGQILPDGADFASLTGKYNDSGQDINHDGLFEYLNIDVGVSIIYPGEYSLHGFLYRRNTVRTA